jgi:hypothetical protein
MADRPEHPGRAFRDHLLEQTFGLRHHHQQAYRRAAGGLAEDRDIAGIAAEHRDIALDPLERRYHVQQSIVTGDALRRFAG